MSLSVPVPPSMPSSEPERSAEAVRRALPELVKPDRYERRAIARRDRASRQSRGDCARVRPPPCRRPALFAAQEAAHRRCGDESGKLDASMRSCNGVRVLTYRHVFGRTGFMPLCALVAAVLAGCATSDGVGSLLTDPGHYSVYHCDGLKARLIWLLAREQELTNLMERASEGGGGVLIGNLTYRADYENAVGEEKVLRRTAAEKKCDLPLLAAPARPGNR